MTSPHTLRSLHAPIHLVPEDLFIHKLLVILLHHLGRKDLAVLDKLAEIERKVREEHGGGEVQHGGEEGVGAGEEVCEDRGSRGICAESQLAVVCRMCAWVKIFDPPYR